jgi:hypothetical protein
VSHLSPFTAPLVFCSNSSKREGAEAGGKKTKEATRKTKEPTREEASETCDSHVRQMRELGNKTEVLVDALTH